MRGRSRALALATALVLPACAASGGLDAGTSAELATLVDDARSAAASGDAPAAVHVLDELRSRVTALTDGGSLDEERAASIARAVDEVEALLDASGDHTPVPTDDEAGDDVDDPAESDGEDDDPRTEGGDEKGKDEGKGKGKGKGKDEGKGRGKGEG